MSGDDIKRNERSPSMVNRDDSCMEHFKHILFPFDDAKEYRSFRSRAIPK